GQHGGVSPDWGRDTRGVMVVWVVFWGGVTPGKWAVLRFPQQTQRLLPPVYPRPNERPSARMSFPEAARHLERHRLRPPPGGASAMRQAIVAGRLSRRRPTDLDNG